MRLGRAEIETKDERRTIHARVMSEAFAKLPPQAMYKQLKCACVGREGLQLAEVEMTELKLNDQQKGDVKDVRAATAASHLHLCALQQLKSAPG